MPPPKGREPRATRPSRGTASPGSPGSPGGGPRRRRSGPQGTPARREPPANAPEGPRPLLLDAAVRARFELSWGKARDYVKGGKIKVDGAVVTEPTARVGPSAEITLDLRAPRPRGHTELDEARVVYFDGHVIVVDKPAGISTIPYDESETGTLDERVRAFLARRDRGASRAGGSRPALGVVHRIDKETSGLVVFTRTWLAKQALSAQFREHTVHRRYYAIVHGVLGARTFRSHLVEDRGDGLRGSIEARGARGRKGTHGEPQLAITHVEPIEALEGATLVACRLETGRTHQIRIHLSEAGHPLLGERVYVRGYPGEPIPAPRMMLHAKELGFVHPATEEEVAWEAEVPEDFRETWDRLKK